MTLTDISIRRPVLALVLNALLVVAGVMGLSRLPVRELPAVDPPVVSVSTTYSGAAAEVVETQITRTVENAVSGIEGIRSIESTSREGASSVRIEFTLDQDIEAAANDVRDRVSRIARALPDEADAPVVRKVDSDASPILYATLTSGQMSPLELTDYAKRSLVDRITAVPGVADVRISGERDFAMRIWLDRTALAARGLTVQDVEQALRRDNAELPAGRIEGPEREFTVRTDGRLSTPDAFARIVVARSGDSLVRLGEVARIELGPASTRGGYYVDGVSAIGLGVVRQATANTMEVADGVRALLDDVSASGTLPADARLQVTFDESLYIGESVYQVFHALSVALGLVVLVVWLFLRSARATLIPATAIPVSLVATFAVLAALGYSINVLTLLAVVLAVGLVVDDAIIVVENIGRRIEEGEPPLLAAWRGARQIGFAVVATTAVLVAAILPLALLQDDVGRLFREFAVTLGAAVVFSGLVALTLAPMLCSQVLRPPRRPAPAHGDPKRPARRGIYPRLLDGVLAAPLVSLAVFVGVAAATWMLAVSLPLEFTPVEDRGSFRISISAPEGASQEYTERELAAVEAVLEPYRENGEVASVLSILNPGWGGAAGVHRGFMVVRLASWEDGRRDMQEILNEVRTQLRAIPGARISAYAPGSIGRRASSTRIQVVIGGSSWEQLAQWRDLLEARLVEEPGLDQVTSDYEENKPQLRVSIDRSRASDLGLAVEDIGRTLETLLGGRTVTRYTDRGEEYDVIVQAEAGGRSSPRDLSNVFVRPDRGDRLIPLASVISVEDVAGPAELNRFDRLRAVELTADLVDGISLGEAAARVRRAAEEVLPPEARISFDGAARDLEESGRQVVFAFGLALLVAFLVLAAQFESFTLPAVVMLTVPLALFGGLGALTLAGMSLNIYTSIGLILLIGLVAKNAILVVEFANQLREEGLDLDQAVRRAAAARLRPIAMTSIATVLGAMPLALAQGAGAEARGAIGLVIVGGVATGSLLSLFAAPLLYRLLARNVRPVGTIRRRLIELEHRYGAAE